MTRPVARLSTWNVLLRAALAAFALVVLIAPALVVTAAFLPETPVIARLGALLDVSLVWILGAVLASTVLSGLAVVLGGRRFTILLLAASLVVLTGGGAVAYRYFAFVGEQHASFDLLRTAASAGEPPTADARGVYAQPGGEELAVDLWRPLAAAAGGRAGGRAAVVYLHGGAFVGGGLGTRPALFDALRTAGVVVVDVQYRLTPPPRWQDAPADVLCALAWLRTMAASENVDPARVVVMGESAGGSLALVAAYAAGTGRLTASCPGEQIAPAGVIAVAPAADLAGIWEDRTLAIDDRPFPEEYIGGPPSQYPDRYEAASPFRLMRAGLPPTLLLAAENDHLVRLARVRTVAEALKAAGADVRYLVIPFAEHGFDGLSNGFGAQVELSVVRAFLAEVAG